MVRILLIDNYPYGKDVNERCNRFREILKGINLEVMGFDKLGGNLDEFDGFILTGSDINLRKKENIERFKDEIELVRNSRKPILGICFGHQLIGIAFGFNIRKMKDPKAEWGKDIKIKVKPFELCDKNEIIIEENHHEEIEYAPEVEKVFEILASTEECRIQIMRHKEKKIFGVQFHPETSQKSAIKEDGEDIIRRFAEIASE